MQPASARQEQHGCDVVDAQSDAFFCLADGSGQGQAFAGCDGACDPGLWCGEPELAGGCCLPLCDLNLPQCPGAMLQCLPFYAMGDAPAGLEHLGICRVP